MRTIFQSGASNRTRDAGDNRFLACDRPKYAHTRGISCEVTVSGLLIVSARPTRRALRWARSRARTSAILPSHRQRQRHNGHPGDVGYPPHRAQSIFASGADGLRPPLGLQDVRYLLTHPQGGRGKTHEATSGHRVQVVSTIGARHARARIFASHLPLAILALCRDHGGLLVVLNPTRCRLAILTPTAARGLASHRDLGRSPCSLAAGRDARDPASACCQPAHVLSASALLRVDLVSFAVEWEGAANQ